jgi:hypothetical protein
MRACEQSGWRLGFVNQEGNMLRLRESLCK